MELLDVRGPPERRFWKVRWAGGLTDVAADWDGVDRGGWLNDWQPDCNLTCEKLKDAFWDRPKQRRLGRSWAYEGRNSDGSGQLRCTHCNKMGFKHATSHDKHVSKCKFAPRTRAKNSLIGQAIVRQRKAALQERYPAATVTDFVGKRHVFKAWLDATYLGHINSACTRSTSRR